MRLIPPSLVLVLLIAAVATGDVAAQEVVRVDEPTWLILERGRLAFDSREFGEALRLFRAVKERNSTMPEVDFEIGRVFEAEGEMELALMQYERAYERKELMIVPDDAIDLLYRLARLRETREDYLQHEQLLRTIIEEIDDRFAQSPSRLEEPLYRLLTTDGLDKLVELYRFYDSGSQRAYHLLSRTLLYHGRRYIEASKYAAISIVMTLTEIIEFARYIDPEYEFSGTEWLIATTRRFSSVGDYIEEAALYDQLYVLGHALFLSDRLIPAESVRQLLIRIDPGGKTGYRAARGYPPL